MAGLRGSTPPGVPQALRSHVGAGLAWVVLLCSCWAPVRAAAGVEELSAEAAGPGVGGTPNRTGAPETFPRRAAAALTFGDEGVQKEEILSEVVSGTLILRAEIPWESVGHVPVPLGQTIADVAAVESWAVLIKKGSSTIVETRDGSDIPTQDFSFPYNVLAEDGRSSSVMNSLVDSAIGDANQQPFIRQLAYELLAYGPTSSVSIGGWRVMFSSTEVERMTVMRPVTDGSAGVSSGGADGSSSAASECWSHASACDCATSTGCTWGTNRCTRDADGAGVACAQCPTQARCGPTSCSQLDEPCACMESHQDCRWDETYDRCLQRAGGSTPCSACARQGDCDPPKVDAFGPPRGTLLLMPDHLQLRIVFDRPIRLSGSGTASFTCTALTRPMVVPAEQMSISVQELRVSVESLVGSELGNEARTCQLSISEGLVTDYLRVPFLGLTGGDAYTFSLGDTIAPHVVEADPPNGGSGVVPKLVTLTFNEFIRKNPSVNAMAVFASLESESTAKDFDLWGPKVEVFENMLRVDIADEVLQQGVLYSLSLPRGTVLDQAGNVFEGLPLATYAFRASSFVSGGGQDVEPPDLGNVSVYIAGGGAGVVALGMIIYVCVYWRTLAMTYGGKGKKSAVQPVPVQVQHSRSSIGMRPTRSSTSTSTKTSTKSEEKRSNVYASKAEHEQPTDPLDESSDSMYWPGGRASRSPGVSGVRAQVLPNMKGSWDQQRTRAQQRWQKGNTFATAAEAARRFGAAGQEHESKRNAGSPVPNAWDGPFTSSDAEGQRDGDNGGDPVGPTKSASRSERGGEPVGSTKTNRSEKSAGGGVGPTAGRTKSTRSSTGGGASNRPKSAPPEREQAPVAQDEPDSEIKRLKMQVERRLRGCMEKPVAERKKVLRELMLEYHPDKNNEEHAKDIFQFINASRGWFLKEN